MRQHFIPPLLLVVFLLLTGCAPDPTTTLRRQMAEDAPQLSVQQSHRITVALLDVFRDELAYSYRRGIYLIHDNTTGVDYVGVSGVGISELGSHSNGKSSIPDELGSYSNGSSSVPDER